jgi:hypothetical protein
MPLKPAALKKTLGERIGAKVGKASGWLPAVAAFLCLCLFAAAAITLFDANSVPETGQKANATGLSAQGTAGLRRLLEARGHEIIINRMEDGPMIEHGDLEIITLDDDGGTLTYAYHFDSDGKASSSSSSASASSASSSSASGESTSSAPPLVSIDVESASASSEASSSADGDGENYGATQIPDPKRSKHVLRQPLGKVVLIVAPKWNAGPDPRNRNWDRGPTLVASANVLESLGFLSPVSEAPAPEDDKQAIARIQASPPGTRTVRNGDSLVTFDTASYVLKRDTRALSAAEIEAAGNGEKNLPLKHLWTFKPAAEGHAFAAPVPVGVITGLQSITGPNLKPLLVGPNGEAVLSQVIVTGNRPQPKVPVYLLSDPDLLNNQILADPQKVVAALGLVDTISPKASRPGRVIFNLTFNGISTDHDLVHALSRPPFIAVPLCLLIAGLGLMWAAFSRFGQAREAPIEAPLGRGVKILADNAARLMAITLKEVRLGPAYADLVRDQVLKDKGYRLGVSPESPDDLAERLGQAQKTTDSFIDLKARSAKVMTVHQLIDITLKLHAWKTEIQRAHT